MKTRDEVRFGDREREYVFSVAMKYVKDEEEAADVAQDAMLLAYRHRASFRGDSRFTTWLYRVAATTALMHLRKKRRARTAFAIPGDAAAGAGDVGVDLVAPEPNPEEAVSAQEAVGLARA